MHFANFAKRARTRVHINPFLCYKASHSRIPFFWMLAISLCAAPSVATGQSGWLFPDEALRADINRTECEQFRLYSHHTGLMPLNPHRLNAELTDSMEQRDPGESLPAHTRLQGALAEVRGGQSGKQGSTPWLRRFYRDGRHFYSYYGRDVVLLLDPLIDLGAGRESQWDHWHIDNRRGLSVRGSVDGKFSFRMSVLETQQTVPPYVIDYEARHAAFPGAGRYKAFSGTLIRGDRGFDYLLAEGELSASLSRSVSMSIGHGRHFIGFGLRSLLLSDAAPPHFYLRLNTNVWRLHYQNIFAELGAGSPAELGDRLLPKKYMVSHLLSANLTPRWNLGLFESVVFNRQDHFEFQYLNPVILYRFVEHALGSPDNVLLGLQSKWLVGHRTALYGQLLFDELVLKQFFRQSGWWGNKYAWQIGVLHFGRGLWEDFSMQAEANLVRPYTYAFRDSIGNYSHLHQALGHPLGANFVELASVFRYRFGARGEAQLRLTWHAQGVDSASVNFGGNVLRDYGSRPGDYGVDLLQGMRQDVFRAEAGISWQLLPRTFVYGSFHLRNERSLANKRSYVWFLMGLRMTLDRQRFDL